MCVLVVGEMLAEINARACNWDFIVFFKMEFEKESGKLCLHFNTVLTPTPKAKMNEEGAQYGKDSAGTGVQSSLPATRKCLQFTSLIHKNNLLEFSMRVFTAI